MDKAKLHLLGDITKYPAEAIVNAASKYLEHGGGVALAIAKAATKGNPDEYTRLSKDEMYKQIGRDYIEHGEVAPWLWSDTELNSLSTPSGLYANESGTRSLRKRLERFRSPHLKTVVPKVKYLAIR